MSLANQKSRKSTVDLSMDLSLGRIATKGKITDLSAPFSLSDGYPFSVFIIPKAAGTVPDAVTAIINCKLYMETAADDCPFTCNAWDVPLVSEISALGISLTDFDVYWGTGFKTVD